MQLHVVGVELLDALQQIVGRLPRRRGRVRDDIGGPAQRQRHGRRDRDRVAVAARQEADEAGSASRP
jgi:hypothetical protein